MPDLYIIIGEGCISWHYCLSRPPPGPVKIHINFMVLAPLPIRRLDLSFPSLFLPYGVSKYGVRYQSVRVVYFKVAGYISFPIAQLKQSWHNVGIIV